MGFVPTTILEVAELIRQTETVMLVELMNGAQAWIPKSERVLVDMLPGKHLVIAKWYYDKEIRPLLRRE
jgi:hypothetical protein